MPNCADSARPSSDERLQKAAAILAAGVFRLHQRAALLPDNAQENPAELPGTGLEVSDETALSVHTD